MEQPVLPKEPAGKDTIVFQVGRSVSMSVASISLCEMESHGIRRTTLDLRDKSLA